MRIAKTWRSAWGITSLGLLGALVAFAIVKWQANAAAESRWEHSLDELKESGAPITLEELRLPLPTPDQNAGTYLLRAHVPSDAIRKEVEAAWNNASEEDQIAAELDRPNADLVKAMREALDAYPEAEKLLRQAVECPVYRIEFSSVDDTTTFEETLRKHVLALRAAMRVMDSRVAVQIADGDFDGAIATAMMLWRLSRGVNANPTIYPAMIAYPAGSMALGMMDLALRSGDISDTMLDRLIDELSHEDFTEVHRNNLITERAYALDVLRETASGMHRQKEDMSHYDFQSQAAFRQHCEAYLELMAIGLELTDRSYADWVASRELAEAQEKTKPLKYLVAAPLILIQATMLETLAKLRCVLILALFERYERAHPGVIPAIADLELPVEVTTDPFNNRPLHIKRLPVGWLIYSVHKNLKDEGGHWSLQDDIGYGPLPRTLSGFGERNEWDQD